MRPLSPGPSLATFDWAFLLQFWRIGLPQALQELHPLLEHLLQIMAEVKITAVPLYPPAVDDSAIGHTDAGLKGLKFTYDNLTNF